MYYHFTELQVRDIIRAFADGMGMEGLSFNNGDEDLRGGADAWAWKDGQRIDFEVKACADRVKASDRGKRARPGRFRIDPDQYENYGTETLWYVFVVYKPTGWAGRTPIHGEILKTKLVRSDKLPERDRPFCLSVSKIWKEE